MNHRPSVCFRFAVLPTVTLALAACAPAPPLGDAGDAATTDAPIADATTDAPIRDGSDGAVTRDAPDDHAPPPDARDTDGSTTMDASLSDGGPCSPVNVAMVQQHVFVGCAGLFRCHGSTSGGPMPGGNLDLRDGQSYANLVNVPASIAPGSLRVRPGDVTGSFLWRKLTNMLPADGSQGAPMPQGEGIAWHLLPPDQLDLVRCWIAQGAPEH